jgi:hypothetical protein
MASGPRTLDWVSALSRGNDAEFIDSYLGAGQVSPYVTLSLWSAFGGRWNEEEG